MTNGLGGYASGTVAGVATRRYHGLLIAALPAPLGRMMMLNHLSELVRLPDGTHRPLRRRGAAGGRLELHGADHLTRVPPGSRACRSGAIEVDGFVLEKRVLLPHRQNTVYVTYRLVAGDGTGAAEAAAVRPFPLARRPGQHAASARHVL